MRYQQLIERVINLFTPEEKAQYADEVWDILQKSYEKIGGFKSASSPEELIAKTSLWKLIARNGKVTSANIYSDKLGRKGIAFGTDGSEQGKRDFLMVQKEDQKYGRMWSEVSGPLEQVMKKRGAVPISSEYAEILTGKHILEYNTDGYHYTRLISGEPHEKVIYGFVKLDQTTQQNLIDIGIDLKKLPDGIRLAK